MGFDLEGVNPTTKRGEYFRNNCWWWRRLWVFVCGLNVLPDEASEKGQYNDGYEVTSELAAKLSERITDYIESGTVKKCEIEVQKYLDSLPKVTCRLCKGRGIRHDSIAIVNGWDKKPCNACNGAGKVNDEELNYPFTEENVREFRDFVASSGGFRIY